MIRRLQPGVVAFACALLFTVLAVVVLVTAYSYSRASGLFPVFVGWIFLALTLLETGVQLKAMRQGDAPAVVTTDAAKAVATGGAMRELGGFGWLGLMLLVLYAAGFLVATPVFMFSFLRVAARRSILQSASIALAATAVVYAVFAWLLEYKLYAGILFGA